MTYFEERSCSPLSNVENSWTSYHHHLVEDEDEHEHDHDHLGEDVDDIGESGFDEDCDHMYVL